MPSMNVVDCYDAYGQRTMLVQPEFERIEAEEKAEIMRQIDEARNDAKLETIGVVSENEEAEVGGAVTGAEVASE